MLPQIIQKEFVQRFKGEIPGEIELETKNKCRYIIQVIKNQEEQLVLAAGWGSFVQKFRLEMGDRIILFGYNGNSRFSVIILDQLGREKASSVVDPLPPRALERHTNGAETVSQHPSDGPVDCSPPLMLMPPPAHFDVQPQQQAMLMQPPLNHSSSSKSSAGIKIAHNIFSPF